MAVRRKAVQHEKIAQAHIQQLLLSISAKVYVLGTRRPGGKLCPKCGTFVAEHQGTCQTAGLSDLLAFLPHRTEYVEPDRVLLFVECKANGGRMSEEQREFRELCLASANYHVDGDLDAVIAWLCAHRYVKAEQFPHYRQPKPPDAGRELGADAASAALQQFVSTRFPRRETR